MNKLQNTVKIIVLYIITLILGVLIPKDKKKIIIVSSKGASYNGNAKALYEHIINNNSELEPYFYVSDKNLVRELSSRFENIIYQYSFKGLWIFLRAKTVCITHGFADVFGFVVSPFQNWIYLGHGIGTKALGYLKEKNTLQEKIEIIFNKCFIYTITSDFDRYMFCTMNHLKPNRVIVTGYPRTDCLYQSDVKKTNKKIKRILYAPTYRKDGITEIFPFEDFETKDLLLTLKEHQLELNVRFHPNNYKDSRSQIESFLEKSNNIIDKSPDVVSDVQDLLLDADILITDFSSISRDFLFLDRPMIFIMNGIEDLGKLALPIREEYAFCGYKVRTMDEFKEALEEILAGKDRYAEVRRFVRDLSYNYVDDKSSERVATLIKDIA